MNQTNFCQ